MTIKKGNLSCMVIEFHMGDVLDENDNFNVWKPIIHGYTNLHVTFKKRYSSVFFGMEALT